MANCETVETTLAELGLLVMQDRILRSVVGIITAERLSTSWWNHPKAHEIFRCLDRLGDGGDVLVCRLVGWAGGRDLMDRIEPERARAQLEAAVVGIEGTAAMLPWNRLVERKTRRSKG